MLLIKIKIARCQSEVALTALAGRYFIFTCMYCVCSLRPLLVFVIVFRVIFVLYCSLVVILIFVLLYLDLGLLFVLRLIAFKLLSLNARGIRFLLEGSLFLIGCLNLLLIYVFFRKRIAPQKWRMNGKAKRSFPMQLIRVEAFLFLLKIS